jgi:predicted phage-related endonuclease
MTPAERAARATTLGASEVPTIAHVPGAYGSELLVWAEKLGHLPVEVREAERARGIDMPPPPSDRDEWYVRLGNLLEEPLAQAFAERTGLTVGPCPGRIRHPRLEWVSATPDRTVEGTGVKSLLEIKKRRSTDGWGEDGSDIVAPSVFCQVQWQMLATESRRAYVAALFGGVEFRHYTIEPDHKYQQDLTDIASAWWQRHVVHRERPPIDGSEETRRFLEKWYPVQNTTEAEWPEDQRQEASRLAIEYAGEAILIREASKRKELAANKLRALMGPRSVVEDVWGKATWSSQRSAPPWKQIAIEMGEDEAMRRAKQLASTHRVLRVRMIGGDDE